MKVYIHNTCSGLELIPYQPEIRDGKWTSEDYNIIPLDAQQRYKFKGKRPFGRTSSTMVFELRAGRKRSDNEDGLQAGRMNIIDQNNLPQLLWGYRVFLALDFVV